MRLYDRVPERVRCVYRPSYYGEGACGPRSADEPSDMCRVVTISLYYVYALGGRFVTEKSLQIYRKLFVKK